ncbi:dihydrolipoamide acetyltransferase family protein [Acetobacterium woodii]|nr:dihydrolipoamide acetyltransferase family protein [Acetobacterium woodii]
MAKIMNMPKIGVNMTDGTITEWYVNEGDKVKFGEMALAAETDKDVQDIPADQSGIVLKIIAQAGDNVECHKPLAIVGNAGENIDHLMAEISGQPEPPSTAPQVAEKRVDTAGAKESIVQKNESGRIPVSPLAKKMAKDLGIDLAAVNYQGIRIVKADILAYQDLKKEEAPEVSNEMLPVSINGNVVSYSGMRKKIGSRMTESVNTKPWAALTMAVDMTETVNWRKRVNEMAQLKVGFNEMLAKACSRALIEFPKINAQLAADGNEIYELNDINIGIAVDTDSGLMVPVLKNVERKGVIELAEDFKGLVERTKARENISGDLSGGTFTISNLGGRGVSNFRAVINPPECAILAVAATIKTAVVVADEIVIRPMMNITLSFDHRMVDGDYAAQFLGFIKNLLEEPMKILM